LQKILVENEFDIIQLEGLYLAPYIKQIRKYSNAIISLRAHNVEHEIWKRSAENLSPGAKKFYFNSIANRLEQFEKRTMDQYDLLIPITNRDALKLVEMGNTKPYKVIPTGIPEKEFMKSYAPNKINSLFYIGALDWIPNQDGLKWFVTEVWNDLRNSNPNLSFHIAGRNAPRWFANFCENNGVVFHGEVESAKEFYKNHHIMVVPLFAGSGMRIKIIEAMAQSKIVITTSIGAEGLGLKNNEHAIIADNASEIKKGILNLLENKEFFSKLENNSFNFIKENFSNEKIGKELIDFYKQQLIT
jgi:glycosyltransferase involved in cell wall biosynthesis